MSVTGNASNPQIGVGFMYVLDYEYLYDGGDDDSVALVRERTMPTERPPLVCEVSANFCG
jgi:hypothetical protein